MYKNTNKKRTTTPLSPNQTHDSLNESRTRAARSSMCDCMSVPFCFPFHVIFKRRFNYSLSMCACVLFLVLFVIYSVCLLINWLLLYLFPFYRPRFKFIQDIVAFVTTTYCVIATNHFSLFLFIYLFIQNFTIICNIYVLFLRLICAIEMSLCHSEIVPLFPKKKSIMCVNCQVDIFSFRQMTIWHSIAFALNNNNCLDEIFHQFYNDERKKRR